TCRSALCRRAPRAERAGRETRSRTPRTEWSGSFANALDEPPAFVDRRQADIEPCAVALGDLERLRLEHARERNAPLGRSTRAEQWRQQNERLGEDVGHHDVVELGRQRFG